MKPVSHFRIKPTFGTFLAATAVFIAGQANAQNYALLTSKPQPQAATTAPESTKAFWKMTTEPGADSTLVGFYKPDNTLIYEEKLPNKAVKLTKKHIRTLNETTAQLAAANAPTPAANTLAEALSGRTAPQAGPLQIGTYPSQDGIHLHLMMENPTQEYVAIEILDDSHRAVYRTGTRDAKHHFKFNMAEMPVGNYQLRVLGKKQTFDRYLTFSYPKPDPAMPTLRMAVK